MAPTNPWHFLPLFASYDPQTAQVAPSETSWEVIHGEVVSPTELLPSRFRQYAKLGRVMTFREHP